jgi:hypothetical protein
MMERTNNEAARGPACVQCGSVESPITVGPGPGWLAVMLWGAAAGFWLLGMALQSLWVGYVAAPVFLAALIYTLWYFYRREKACRHCGGRWATGGAVDRPDPGADSSPR